MRILHAPYDIAGQPYYISRGQRKIGLESDVLVFKPNPLREFYDINLGVDLEGKTSILDMLKIIKGLLSCLVRYDVFHFHFASSFLGTSKYHLDILLLRLFGKKVVMEYWGSDIRQPDKALEYTKFTKEELRKFSVHFDGEGYKIRKRIKWIDKLVNKSILGDYSLLPYMPEATVVKQALILEDYPYVGCEKTDKPKIVHAPTNRLYKGTKHVLKAIDRLASEGYEFSFKLIEDIKRSNAISEYMTAHVVVDQLMGEGHGTLAVECMALGKPVICRIDEKLMKYYRDTPIVNADPDTIYEKLKELIVDHGLRKELGLRGRRYAEKYHDSRVIAEQLLDLYESL